MDNRPSIFTPGDPAGIGFEVLFKALRQSRIPLSSFFIISHPEILKQSMKIFKIDFELNSLGIDSSFQKGKLNFWPLKGRAGKVKPGKPDHFNSKLSYEAVLQGIDLMQEGAGSALVTGPVSKYEIQKAGIRGFRGHTDLLAARTKTKKYHMVFGGSRANVGLITVHESVRRAVRHITKQSVIDAFLNIDYYLSGSGTAAVLGLNPHAGEGGALGQEEIEEICPAVLELQKRGYSVEGPFPADSFWGYAFRTGKYKLILAMYHDQGLIPVKSGLIGPSVNITVGLPFVRTSVDHGTAFDIAGTDTASSDGLVRAFRWARKLSDKETFKR